MAQAKGTQAISVSGVSEQKNPITVVLNFDSTSREAELYAGFCAIVPAPHGKPQWLALRCYEATLDGPFLTTKILDQDKHLTFRLRIPASAVLLVSEASATPDEKEAG